MRRLPGFFLVVAAGVVLAAGQDPAQDHLRRQREAFANGFNLPREHPRLAGYLRLLSRALGGPAAFRAHTVSALPVSSSDRNRVLQAAAELVAGRFRFDPARVTARFASIARPYAGRVVTRGDAITIEISDRHRHDDDRLLAVMAHEFAHAALDRALDGTPDAGLASDESLVDAAAVMVGLGPIILRASFDEEFKGSGGSARWEVIRVGELDPVAIAYLTLVQAELAGIDEDGRRTIIARWMEPAWSFRRDQMAGDGRASRPAGRCPTCESPVASSGGVTCHVCGSSLPTRRTP
jgi:hypothetical protein